MFISVLFSRSNIKQLYIYISFLKFEQFIMSEGLICELKELHFICDSLPKISISIRNFFPRENFSGDAKAS